MTRDPHEDALLYDQDAWDRRYPEVFPEDLDRLADREVAARQDGGTR